MRDASHDPRALIEREDFAALERAARDAVRRGDTDRQHALAGALHAWLVARWRERPLPRLAELATLLGTLLAGPAAERLRAFDPAGTKKVPDPLWLELRPRTAADLDPRDVAAVLDAAMRTEVRTIASRFAELVPALPRHPRVTSTVLRWLDAPPVRSTSSQPAWRQVLELLFAQADPRTPAALERLAAGTFPAGASMAAWMADRLARELARWQARPDAADLAALSTPTAEGPLGAPLDAIALAVSALTGEALVAQGGEVVTAALEPLLAPRPAATPAWTPRHAPRSTDGLLIDWNPWSSLSADTARRRAVVVGDGELAVFDADGSLRALRSSDDAALDGAALSPSGRWLALLWSRDAPSLELVDLDDDTAPALVCALDLGAQPPPHRSAQLRARPTLAWYADERRLLHAHTLLWRHPEGSVLGYRLVVVETVFDPAHRAVAAQRCVFDLSAPPDAPQRASGLEAVYDLATLALSPDERWLHVNAVVDRHRQYRALLLERDADDGWTLRHALHSGSDVACAWHEGRLAWCRNLSHGRRVTPVGWLDPASAGFEVAKSAEAQLVTGGEAGRAWPHPLPAPACSAVAVARDAPRVAMACTLAGGRLGWWTLPGIASEGGACARDSERSAGIASEGGACAAGELGANSTIHALALAPDGSWLVYGEARTVQRITVGEDGRSKRAGKGLSGHKDGVTGLAITADAARIVSAAADTVFVWDAASGTRQHDLRHRGAPRLLAPRGCSRLLATAEAHRVVVWDLESGLELAELPRPEDQPPVAGLCWSADETAVLFAQGHALHRWLPGHDASELVLEHDAELSALAADPASATVAAGDVEGRAFVLDGAALRLVSQHAGAVRALAVGHGGRIAVGCGALGRVGSLLVLRPDEQGGTGIGAVGAGVVAQALAAPAGLAAAARVEAPSALEHVLEVRRRVLDAPPPTGVAAGAALDKVRRALRRTRGRLDAIEAFAALADDGLWLRTLAELEPGASAADPVFDLRGGSERDLWIGALLARAPDGLELVEAWRRVPRYLWLDEPAVAPDGLALPCVTHVALTLRSAGRDLSGFPALETVELNVRVLAAGRNASAETLARYDALVRELRLPEGCRPRLCVNVADLPRPPVLRGTPFDRVELRIGALRELSGLDEVRSLAVSDLALSALHGLESCARLETLTVNERSYTARTLVSLAGLDGALAGGSPLQHLTLRQTDVLADLEPLAGATALVALHVGRSALRDLRPLAGLHALRTLEITNASGLASLEGVASALLESVDLSGTAVAALDALVPSVATLRELRLKNCAALRSVELLEAARALQILDLRGCGNVTCLPRLETCAALSVVALGGSGIAPQQLSPWLRARATWAEEPEFELMLRAREASR